MHIIELTVTPVDMVDTAIFTQHLDDVCLQGYVWVVGQEEGQPCGVCPTGQKTYIIVGQSLHLLHVNNFQFDGRRSGLIPVTV